MRDDRLPSRVGLAGLLLATAALLPLSPAGDSFVALVADAFRRAEMQGLGRRVAVGSPFWFGLAVAGCAFVPGSPPEGAQTTHAAAHKAMQVTLSFVHGQLLLFAGTFVWHGVGVARWALLGFAIVSAGYYVHGSALARSQSEDGQGGPKTLWLARWGASILAGICLWARLQMLDGLHLGIAVEAVLLAAITIVWQVAPRRAAP